jgi:hypothetical protein
MLCLFVRSQQSALPLSNCTERGGADSLLLGTSNRLAIQSRMPSRRCARSECAPGRDRRRSSAVVRLKLATARRAAGQLPPARANNHLLTRSISCQQAGSISGNLRPRLAAFTGIIFVGCDEKDEVRVRDDGGVAGAYSGDRGGSRRRVGAPVPGPAGRVEEACVRDECQPRNVVEAREPEVSQAWHGLIETAGGSGHGV